MLNLCSNIVQIQMLFILFDKNSTIVQILFILFDKNSYLIHNLFKSNAPYCASFIICSNIVHHVTFEIHTYFCLEQTPLKTQSLFKVCSIFYFSQTLFNTKWFLWSNYYSVLTLFKRCSKLKLCSNCQLTFNLCSNLVQVLFKPCSNFVQNIVQCRFSIDHWSILSLDLFWPNSAHSITGLYPRSKLAQTVDTAGIHREGYQQ